MPVRKTIKQKVVALRNFGRRLFGRKTAKLQPGLGSKAKKAINKAISNAYAPTRINSQLHKKKTSETRISFPNPNTHTGPKYGPRGAAFPSVENLNAPNSNPATNKGTPIFFKESPMQTYSTIRKQRVKAFPSVSENTITQSRKFSKTEILKNTTALAEQVAANNAKVLKLREELAKFKANQKLERGDVSSNVSEENWSDPNEVWDYDATKQPTPPNELPLTKSIPRHSSTRKTRYPTRVTQRK